jgi:hypothetical protein
MRSSINGKNYETLVSKLLKLTATPAGSNRHANDIRLPWNGRMIDIEVKQTKGAEFGQCRASMIDGVLTVSNPLFQECIAHTELFGGKIPPFLQKKMMLYHEWEEVSSEFRDELYTAPRTSISKYYFDKGNSYIQIRGLGLYHTGEDVCNFGVPFFECLTQLRVRCKRHGLKCPVTKNDIPSSVMTSFWIKTPPKASPYSLDDVSTFPPSLEI